MQIDGDDILPQKNPEVHTFSHTFGVEDFIKYTIHEPQVALLI